MKKIFLNNYKNVICIIIGILFLALGTAFFKNSDFGSDALSTLNIGLAKLLKLEYGTTNIIMNGTALIILLIIERKYLGIGTVLVTFLLGLTINLIDYLAFIPNLDSFNNVWYIEYSIKILYIILANVICAFGIAIYMYADRGLTGFEGILLKIHNITKIPFGVVKIINDVIFISVGFFLGAKIHIGTIISVVSFGPLVDLFGKLLRKINFMGVKNEKNK